jgi:hypothetical protein
MKLAVAMLVLLLTGCSATSTIPPLPDEPGRTWLGMVPGDAIPFDGPSGELVLIYVDETYSIGHVNASALTWKLGEEYTTDYFLEEDDGTLWWYGRRGSWRAGRRGEEPRPIEIVDLRARFGDRVISLSDDGGPVELETPDGVYSR